ncbi:MAG: hypothetical protein JW894_12460 [Bacteroidales bacterium]|nr:hypothetical protein [Bacteroidales bacterium]
MNIILPEIDPVDSAVYNYYTTSESIDVIVRSNIAEDDVIPSEYLFRGYRQMPKLEQIALKNCKGNILDADAFAGCHSIWLQQNNCITTPLEISGLCCKVMKTEMLRTY